MIRLRVIRSEYVFAGDEYCLDIAVGVCLKNKYSRHLTKRAPGSAGTRSLLKKYGHGGFSSLGWNRGCFWLMAVLYRGNLLDWI